MSANRFTSRAAAPGTARWVALLLVAALLAWASGGAFALHWSVAHADADHHGHAQTDCPACHALTHAGGVADAAGHSLVPAHPPIDRLVPTSDQPARPVRLTTAPTRGPPISL